MTHRLRLFLGLALVSAIPALGPVVIGQSASPPDAKKAVEIEDVIAWKNISAVSLPKGGEWFAYRIEPQEGDAELVVRNIASGKELKFPMGEVGAPSGGGPAAPADPPAGRAAARSRSPTTRSGSRSPRVRRAQRRSACAASAVRCRRARSS